MFFYIKDKKFRRQRQGASFDGNIQGLSAAVSSSGWVFFNPVRKLCVFMIFFRFCSFYNYYSAEVNYNKNIELVQCENSGMDFVFLYDVISILASQFYDHIK